MSAIFASFLLASAVSAKVLPLEEARTASSLIPASSDFSSVPFEGPEPSTTISFDDPTSATVFPNVSATDVSSVGSGNTIFIPVPSQAEPLTTTVSACTKADGEVIDSIVVIGVPGGTFSPSITRTIIAPPQADPTTVTFYDDPPSNATEVIVVKPLPGNCGAFVTPTQGVSATGTDTSASPSNTAAACPTKGCTGAVLRAAETVIDAINEVTQISFDLQSVARKIGASIFPKDDVMLLDNPITDVALGLTRIVNSINTAFPTISTFPAFPPSCSSDTIVLAWLSFVEVHQDLLAILIGRSGLLETGPFPRSEMNVADGTLVERATQGFIGAPIALALRAIEGVVDTLAVGIVDLVPGKSECSKAKSAELKERIKKAQVSYEG